jgi:hypothetical protein
MVYPDTHTDPKLWEKLKGMKVVHKSDLDELSLHCSGRVVGMCKSCQKSQAKKDTKRRVAAAEVMGKEDTLSDKDILQAEKVKVTSENEWCCTYHVFSLHEEFVIEKLRI